jgi:hypothetical protein
MTETEEHERLKRRIGEEYLRRGYTIEYEKTFQGHRWDVVANGPNESLFIECELFSASNLSRSSLTHPEGTRALLYVPAWFGKFDALLVDGKQTIAANPILAESKLPISILASTESIETLKREIQRTPTGNPSTTSYRISVTTRQAFKSVCSALGLDQSPVIEWLVRTFVSAFVGQTKLELFAYPELRATTSVTIIQPQTFNLAIFDKAQVLIAKHELQHLLELLDGEGTEDFKQELQLDLARALGKVRPMCTRNRDPELVALLKKAEVVLKQ